MKILLVCSAGMSTSILVDKMRKAAEVQGLEATIDATAESGLANELGTTNIILIGPQVRYLESKIKSKAEPHGIKVAIIDSMAYGTMNGEKVLQQALAL
ncbi:PTS sugar transporter subunit IIB [Halalkalibacterium halodurans]|jgi:PTS system cellobiose-specific IIB component|uniref:PTS system, cellobiose-specific enzyme II, B component (EIIA-cell) n=1 Tax=Halalkalibacterium halodurans (strain ATCC BAA-125 / DSM 18197 / FERM 7344 / JCM 9153 / C-125) TaxID=272558 RepID=Q9KEE3_HALH5|nr:PTS sugar transporter subunit IIB [Halalkalibacterium halodurans]MDY7221408.1 PTS sugar transporter subunit IIB [Halalkalibacterium halodurans]MDY7240647.1 PTS sugar transporter subunit IIB [Halalkalibacterium halodurans]MED4082935.1 PTS sugar transporter subunit IIB [Halalkalibacterium halodurans]MED4086766.1 PTS sugar transporter subunit IIB [Halalkalibacterium halodurans]MED4106298.1 PTS sugar transporter subunit IIB [Halalkalibacterium halodurans]